MTKNVNWIPTGVKGTLTVFILVLAGQLVKGQVVSVDSSYATFKGTIISASTKEPVEALVKYESMPFSSFIGVMRGSEVMFPVDARTDYLITVSADGFSTFISTIRNSEIRNKQINRTIELIPNMVSDVIRLEKVIFAQGRSEITPESYEELDRLAEMLQVNPSMTIQLEGHTDFRGDERENMKLSQRRVKAVKDYLVDKGINTKRIATKAFGGTQPLTRESDQESRSRNRRVEVRILTN